MLLINHLILWSCRLDKMVAIVILHVSVASLTEEPSSGVSYPKPLYIYIYIYIYMNGRVNFVYLFL